MESKEEKALSIVMLPYLAHGHVSPFYELAKKLSTRGFHIYLCSTPICLQPIRNITHFDDAHNIHLIDLHLPSSFHPELPPHYHSTKNLPPHLTNTLLAAFDASKSAFSDLLRTLRPDLVIYDLFQPWAPEAAGEQNIEAVLFLTSAAAQNMTFEIPALTENNGEIIEYLVNNIVSGMTYTQRFYRSVTSSSKMILVKTLREIEEYRCCHDQRNPYNFVPVGPLVQKSSQDADNGDADEKMIMDWLSKREPRSVVFVSFGSENFLSEEEIQEMGHGLELSGVDFIWVVRFHGGNNEVKTIQEALPSGFLERTKERGLIVGWAPQPKILQHESTGAFVSHCGWSSTLEAMMYGVPIIGLPFKLDQPWNAKLAAEMGVGVEVPRRENKITRREVGKVIKTVVVEEEGKEVRLRAKELSERLKKKEDEEIDVAVEKLVQIVEESKKTHVL